MIRGFISLGLAWYWDKYVYLYVCMHACNIVCMYVYMSVHNCGCNTTVLRNRFQSQNLRDDI